jgi:hypothetical protein
LREVAEWCPEVFEELLVIPHEVIRRMVKFMLLIPFGTNFVHKELALTLPQFIKYVSVEISNALQFEVVEYTHSIC